MTSKVNSQKKETKKQKKSVFQLLAFILLCIFISQIFIHLLFHFELDLKHFIDMISSALLMVIILLPVLYKFVVRPMTLEISLRERAEESLRESNERIETVLLSLPTGLMIIDSETHEIIEANPQAILMTGEPIEQIVGSKCYQFLTCKEEKTKCPITDHSQTIYKAEDILFTAGGERTPIFKSVIPLTLDNRNCLIECFVDIGEYKRAEHERIQKEKLQGIIEMAGAVCHEMNQPMQVVSGYSELLMMDIQDNNPLYENIKTVKEQIDRMSIITKKLMGVTKYKTKDYLKGKIVDIDKATK